MELAPLKHERGSAVEVQAATCSVNQEVTGSMQCLPTSTCFNSDCSCAVIRQKSVIATDWDPDTVSSQQHSCGLSGPSMCSKGCHCFSPTTPDYCGRVSVLGTLQNCVNRLHYDLVELHKDAKMHLEKKSSFLKTSESHVTEILLQLKQSIDTSQSQINDILGLLKTQSLCVHTCECQSSYHSEQKTMHSASTENADSIEVEKQSLALEQVSLLCQVKTSIISDLQRQLQAKEDELSHQKEISQLALNNVDQLQKEKTDLMNNITIVTLQNQTFQEDFSRERDDRTSANKAAFEFTEELKTLRALHETTINQLKECKCELGLVNEEIAVKVAQVKQYQKQVEAYKQQIAHMESAGIEKKISIEDTARGHEEQMIKSVTELISPAMPASSINKDATSGANETGLQCASNGCGTISPDAAAVVRLQGSNPNIEQHSELPSSCCNIQQGCVEEAYMKPHYNIALCGDKSKTSSPDKNLPEQICSKPHNYDPIIPYDPNLQCQFCQLRFRKGEIQLYRCHSQTCPRMQRNLSN